MVNNMTLQFTINDEQFYIEEYADGFAWVTAGDQGKCFTTVTEAQQDAMDYVRICAANLSAAQAEAENDAKYGTAEEQWARDYREAVRVS